MFNRIMTTGLLSAAAVMVGTSATSAAIGDIDSVTIEERVFNDFPGSTLVTTNNYPTQIQFDESAFIPDLIINPNPFANRHDAWFSSDGGSTRHTVLNSEGFDFSVDVTLDADPNTRRKEAGIRIDTKIAGEGLFIVTSDGEIASFGAFFPFNSTNAGGFGGSVTPYTAGDTVNLRVVYTPGDGAAATIPATMEFFVDGLSGGPQDITNLENGVIDGSEIGMYTQHAVFAADIATDAVTTTFDNISIAELSTGLVGDLNGDGFVGIDDLNIVLGAWNQNVPPANPLADPSGDGFVGIDDLNQVLGNWNAGTPPAPGAAVPEPATLGLIGLAGLALVQRRRMN